MNACFDDELLRRLASEYGTPLWVMDAATVRERLASLKAFDLVRYAQKANPNVHLLRLLREAGAKVDAVSRGEALRAFAAGYSAEEIVYTADLLDRESLTFVVERGLTVNAGSADMLRQLAAASPGHAVWIRLNPGFGHGHSKKTNTGGEHSKHGIWHEQLGEALGLIRTGGLRLVGLHMHIGSGVDYGHLAQVGQPILAGQLAVLSLQLIRKAANFGPECFVSPLQPVGRFIPSCQDRLQFKRLGARLRCDLLGYREFEDGRFIQHGVSPQPAGSQGQSLHQAHRQSGRRRQFAR